MVSCFKKIQSVNVMTSWEKVQPDRTVDGASVNLNFPESSTEVSIKLYLVESPIYIL